MDFANFDRKTSYFKPYKSHLDVYVSLRKIDDPIEAMDVWTYKVKIFCEIPIILFQCKNKGCNILLHLNYPLLISLNATSWLEADHLTFMLFLSEKTEFNDVVCAKTIQLSKSESSCIRKACSKQDSLTYQSIENLVDIVYEQDIENIWPLNLV
jgi:hypothetical protein